MENKNKIIGIVCAAVVVCVVVFSSLSLNKKQTDIAAVPTSTLPVVDIAPIPPVDTTKKKPTTFIYKNGTYSATGSYMSPGGPDKLGVSITINDDIITDSTVTNGAGDNTSSKIQDRFISGYKQYVIGKNISDLSLTKVSGASLTPLGFNDALAQIKAKAQI